MNENIELLNKDRVWSRIKKYIYCIVFLIVCMVILLLSSILLQCFILCKLTTAAA